MWDKLLNLYEGGAHTALGYASWAAYCEHEFHMGKTRSYQLLQSARVIQQLPGPSQLTLTQSTIVDSLQVTPQVPESEAIARELVPLLGNPQALDEAWNEAVEEAGGVPTAQGVREVVARKLGSTNTEKKPLHDLEGIEPVNAGIELGDIGLGCEAFKINVHRGVSLGFYHRGAVWLFPWSC